MKLHDAARRLVETHPLTVFPPTSLLAVLSDESRKGFSLTDHFSGGRVEGDAKRTELLRQLSLFADAFQMIRENLGRVYALDDPALDPFRNMNLGSGLLAPQGVTSWPMSVGKVWFDEELQEIDVQGFEHPLVAKHVFNSGSIEKPCPSVLKAYLDPDATRLMALKMCFFPDGYKAVDPSQFTDDGSELRLGTPYHTLLARADLFLHRNGINYSDHVGMGKKVSASLHFSPLVESELGSTLKVGIDVSRDGHVMDWKHHCTMRGTHEIKGSGTVYSEKSFAELFQDIPVDQS